MKKYKIEEFLRMEHVELALAAYAIQSELFKFCESPEERLKREIQELYVKWCQAPSIGEDKEDGKDLAERVYELVRRHIE